MNSFIDHFNLAVNKRLEADCQLQIFERNNMQCWICGKDADSGEHLIKASDLKMIFGKVRQDKPLYMHTDAQRNIRVAGLQSNKLKYEKVICRDCNSGRTQASDKAWELLSRLLKNRTPAIKAGSCVRLA